MLVAYVNGIIPILQILLGFLLIHQLSQCLSDRVLLLTGLCIETLTLAMALTFVPFAVPGNERVALPAIIVGTFCFLAGLPFLLASNTSLLSKVTRKQSQGRRGARIATLAHCCHVNSQIRLLFHHHVVAVNVQVLHKV